MRKYQLASSLHFRYHNVPNCSVPHEIERLSFCGFQYLDFNFLDMCGKRDTDFLKDDYLLWIRECKKTADICGVKFVQAHAPCESVYDGHDYRLLVDLCIRAMECCAVLEIPWMVYHPITDCKGRFGVDEDNFDFNMRFFQELLPYAEKYSVGIAIENIVPFYVDLPFDRMVDEQIRLIDALNSDYVGACWDVGHANVCSFLKETDRISHQSEQIKRLGMRLKCTHIHDNNTKKVAKVLQPDMNQYKELFDAGVFIAFDEHLSPYMGTIDWDDVIEGLDAIDYEHYFTFEAHQAACTLPDQNVNDAIIQLRKIGESILAKSRQ